MRDQHNSAAAWGRAVCTTLSFLKILPGHRCPLLLWMNLIENHLPHFSLLLHTAALEYGVFSLHLPPVAVGLLLSWVLSKLCPFAALQPRRQSGISSCLQECQKCLDPSLASAGALVLQSCSQNTSQARLDALAATVIWGFAQLVWKASKPPRGGQGSKLDASPSPLHAEWGMPHSTGENCSNSPRVPSYHPSWEVVLLPRCPKINYQDNTLLWWHFLFRKIISAPSDFKEEFLKTGK